MAWCARGAALVGVAVALAATAAAAQQPPADAPAVPAGITTRVAALFAERWSVPAGAVVVQWGVPPGGITFAADVPFRLLGGDDDGWFAAVLEPPRRPPRAIRLRAGVAESVTVAARPLARGSRLREGDLALAARVRWGAPEGAQPRPTEGWLVRRAVAAGTTLEAPIVTPPPVVAAGAQVSVEWVSGDISVRFEGTALHDAALGEHVLVRPAGRAGAVRGTVTGPAAVRLAL